MQTLSNESVSTTSSALMTPALELPANRIGRQNRCTVAETVSFTGTGIHTAGATTLRIHPAAPGTGLILQSTSPSLGIIPISPLSVTETAQAVTLSNGSWKVHTVEHVLCAMAVAGITDAILELDGTEIPILDGAAGELYRGIMAAGVQESDVVVEPIRLSAPVWVVKDDKYLVAIPADDFRVTYTIDFPHPELKGKTYHGLLNSEIMEQEVLEARTFGFLKDVEELRKRGLGMGASLENAVVLTDTGYLNDDLRYPDECLRHKVLDLIGDLYLLGRPLMAHIIAFRAGHALDVALGRNIIANLSGDELAGRRN